MSFWQEAAEKCLFPIKYIPKLIDRWTRDSNWNLIQKGNKKRDVDDRKQFLARIDDNHYELGPTYEQEKIILRRTRKKKNRRNERC